MTRLSIVPTFAVVLSLLASACAGHSASPSETPLGPPFDLRAGTSAILDAGLKVTFERVPSDSRCPMDALCIRAGEALVALTISQDGRNAVARELRTDSAASETTYSGYSIKLIALAPYPRSDRQILPEEYVATLAVASR
jgi:hypothetical protein